MTFSSSLLVAANVSEWFSGIWADYLAPRWGSFTQVFVGEDLLIQLGAIAGAVILVCRYSWSSTAVQKGY